MSGKFDQVCQEYTPKPINEIWPAVARVAAPLVARAAPVIARAVGGAGRGVASKGAARGFVAGQALGGSSSGGQAGGSASSTGGNIPAPVTTSQSSPNVDQLANDLTNVSDSNKVKEILAANLK